MGFTALRRMIRPVSRSHSQALKPRRFEFQQHLSERKNPQTQHFTLHLRRLFSTEPSTPRFPHSTSSKHTPLPESPPKTQSNEKKERLGQGLDWSILKRWNVPWQWQTVSVASLASVLSCYGGRFVSLGLVEKAALPCLGVKFAELSAEAKAGILFVNDGIVIAVTLGVLFSILNKFGGLPKDTFRYDLKNPFDLRKGWLLWAEVGFIGALLATLLTAYIMSMFSVVIPKQMKMLEGLPICIGAPSVSTALAIAHVGVLIPILEETLFRGFFMVAMTKWVPTPVAVVISAAAFALAHQSVEKFPAIFIFGVCQGFSYAKTRNLMTPITIHALWNSGAIILIHNIVKRQGRKDMTR